MQNIFDTGSSTIPALSHICFMLLNIYPENLSDTGISTIHAVSAITTFIHLTFIFELGLRF